MREAPPVYIDTEYDTWNMDPAALEKAFEIYPDVKIIVLVHLYGTPAKIDEIRTIADAHGAVIVEDASESLGAFYKGKQTGSFGEYGCISFNGNKIITGSSGGMFLTDSREDAEKVRKWSTQSREAAAWYQHEEVGPGDSFEVKPVVYSDATEEMYVFIQVDMPTTADGALYSFDADNEWIPVSDNDGTIIYAYAGSEMTALQPGDSTSALTEQMTMDEISNAEYAAIDDINITITGYAIGTEDVSENPTEAWEQCKLIGNIQ